MSSIEEFLNPTGVWVQLANSVTDQIYVKSEDGKYLFVNQEGEERFPDAARPLVGKFDYELIDPEQPKEFRRTDLQVVQSGRAAQFIEHFNSDTGPAANITTKLPVINEAEEVVAVACIASDLQYRASHAAAETTVEFLRHDWISELLPHLSAGLRGVASKFATQAIKSTLKLIDPPQGLDQRLDSLSGETLLEYLAATYPSVVFLQDYLKDLRYLKTDKAKLDGDLAITPDQIRKSAKLMGLIWQSVTNGYAPNPKGIDLIVTTDLEFELPVSEGVFRILCFHQIRNHWLHSPEYRDHPVEVSVRKDRSRTSLKFRSYGSPIDPEKTKDILTGSGLGSRMTPPNGRKGLYLCRVLVEPLGGRIGVNTSHESATIPYNEFVIGFDD